MEILQSTAAGCELMYMGPHDSLTFQLKKSPAAAQAAAAILGLQDRVDELDARPDHTKLLQKIYNEFDGNLMHAALNEEEKQDVALLMQELRVVLGPSQLQINIAVRQGEEAFWAEITNHFPEVETGDYPPEKTVSIQYQLKEHLEVWLKYNHPANHQEESGSS